MLGLVTNKLCLSFLKLETQETSIRLNESTVSVKENLNKDRMSNKLVISLSDHILPFEGKWDFSRLQVVIKRREKLSRHVLEDCKHFEDCKQIEENKADSQEPSTNGIDPSLKHPQDEVRVPRQPEDIKGYLISSVYPPVIVNTNHQKTRSFALADNPYRYAKLRDLVESSYGTLKDNFYSYRLKDPFVVDNKTSESSQNVENIHFFAEKLPPTIEDLKEHQPTRGDVAELKSVIGEEVPYFL